MIHRGEIVLNAIRSSKKSITAVAEHMNVHRETIYNWGEIPNLGLERIREIGKFIGYDFRQHFPEMTNLSKFNVVNEPQSYGENSTKEFENKIFRLEKEIENLNTIIERDGKIIALLEKEIEKNAKGNEKIKKIFPKIKRKRVKAH